MSEEQTCATCYSGYGFASDGKGFCGLRPSGMDELMENISEVRKGEHCGWWTGKELPGPGVMLSQLWRKEFGT